jgi:hypothetical protein
MKINLKRSVDNTNYKANAGHNHAPNPNVYHVLLIEDLKDRTRS